MKWIIIIGIFLSVTSCKDSEIKEGIVFKKEFKPAENVYKTERLTRIRNRGRSSSTVTKTFKVAYPDRWIIYIQAGTDTAAFFVSKEVYDAIKVTSWFVFDKTVGTDEEPYKRLN